LVELIEAVLSVYKESYQKKKEMPGQIEILRSRKRQIQNIAVGFIGGAFAPVTCDIVLQREKYIQPKYFKYFYYDFIGIKNFDGKNCYEIEFYPLNKDSVKAHGNLLIDEESLAYVAFEIQSEHPENAKNILGIMKPVQSSIKINYKQQQEKWYLKQIAGNHQYENVRLNGSLSSRLNYVTTYMQTDSVKPIPFDKRLEYMSPIEVKTETYHPSGWTDSDILANENSDQLGLQFSTDEAASVFQQNIPEKFSLRKALIQIVPKLVMGYGIHYDPNQKIILLQSMFGYRFNKKWSIQWQYAEDFYDRNIDLKENSLGFTFKKNLNNAGYPLFLETSLWVSDRSVKRDYEIRTQSIVPQIALSKRISNLITVEFFVNYPILIHSANDHYNSNRYPHTGIIIYVF
jgi:hypothetical protein